MKMPIHSIALVCVLIGSFVKAGERPDYGAKNSKGVPERPIPGAGPGEAEAAAPTAYMTTEELKAIPPCKASVIERSPCTLVLKATDGTTFSLGSPVNTLEFSRFLRGLEDGKTYVFPDVFVEYLKKAQK